MPAKFHGSMRRFSTLSFFLSFFFPTLRDKALSGLTAFVLNIYKKITINNISSRIIFDSSRFYTIKVECFAFYPAKFDEISANVFGQSTLKF